MKKWMLILVIVVLIIGIAAAVFLSVRNDEAHAPRREMLNDDGERFYRKLDDSQIKSIIMRYAVMDHISWVRDIEKVTGWLKKLEFTECEGSYEEYLSHAVTISVRMKDDTEEEIMLCGPFLVKDGVTYRGDGKAYRALAEYAQELWNKKTPPWLKIVCGETEVYAMHGSSSWHEDMGNGEIAYSEGDSLHPLLSKETLSERKLIADAPVVVLDFTVEPDVIEEVVCWSDAHWENPDAPEEPVNFKDCEIELKPGGYIYLVSAQWYNEKNGGTAWYAFYADYSSP